MRPRLKALVDLGIKWVGSMAANPDAARTWLQLVTPVAALAQLGALSEAWALLRDHPVCLRTVHTACVRCHMVLLVPACLGNVNHRVDH